MHIMKRPKIDVFCHKWHLNKSPAFDDMLIDPLSGVVDIERRAIDDPTVDWRSVGVETPAVFCQCLPPREVLYGSRRRLVWLPMWDSLWFRSSSWWAQLPGHLRIVAFSDAIAEKAVNMAATICKIKYFKNPEKYARIHDNASSTLFYWNRTNLFSASSLCAICRYAGARKLILLNAPDPNYVPYNQQELVSICNCINVELHQQFISRPEYIRISREANIFLSPRLTEGVGMAFLEALARGAGVVAVDNPTMNEYIMNGVNGRLISNGDFRLKKRTKVALMLADICRSSPGLSWRAERFLLRQLDRENKSFRDSTDWSFLDGTDWDRLGRNARESHQQGFASWTRDIDRLRSFVLN